MSGTTPVAFLSTSGQPITGRAMAGADVVQALVSTSTVLPPEVLPPFTGGSNVSAIEVPELNLVFPSSLVPGELTNLLLYTLTDPANNSDAFLTGLKFRYRDGIGAKFSWALFDGDPSLTGSRQLAASVTPVFFTPVTPDAGGATEAFLPNAALRSGVWLQLRNELTSPNKMDTLVDLLLVPGPANPVTLAPYVAPVVVVPAGVALRSLPIVRVGDGQMFAEPADAEPYMTAPGVMIIYAGSYYKPLYMSAAHRGALVYGGTTYPGSVIHRDPATSIHDIVQDYRGGYLTGYPLWQDNNPADPANGRPINPFRLSRGVGGHLYEAPVTVWGLPFSGGGGANGASVRDATGFELNNSEGDGAGQAGLYVRGLMVGETARISRCAFNNCQNGHFSPSDHDATKQLVLEHTEFGDTVANSQTKDGLSHNVYSSTGTIKARFCNFRGDFGNTFKSRAPVVWIDHSYLQAGIPGSENLGGRCVDYPSGGAITISNSVLAQHPNTTTNYLGAGNENADNGPARVTLFNNVMQIGRVSSFLRIANGGTIDFAPAGLPPNVWQWFQFGTYVANLNYDPAAAQTGVRGLTLPASAATIGTPVSGVPVVPAAKAYDGPNALVLDLVPNGTAVGVVTGYTSGYLFLPSLTLAVDGGAFGALPAGSSVAFDLVSIAVGNLAAGPHTFQLRDADGVLSNVLTATTQAGATVAPTTPVLLHSFALQNTGNATSRGFARQGVPFRKGQVPAGSSVQIRSGSAVVPAQFDERSTWSDGSLKFAVMHLRDADLAAGVSQSYDVWTVPGAGFVNAGSVSLADINAGISSVPASGNYKVKFGSLTESDDTTTAPVGSANFVAYFGEHIGVPTRVEKIHSGPVVDGYAVWGMARDIGASGAGSGLLQDKHLKVVWYVDVWKNTDGSVYAHEIGAVVAQDWWSIPNKKRRNYDASLTAGLGSGTTVQSYPGVAHPYRSQWLTCQMTGAAQGKRHWVGGAQPTLLYKQDRAYWVAAGVVPPFNLAHTPTGPAYTPTYVPCGAMDHRADINGTGGYMGRGVLPNSDALAFMRPTQADVTAARVEALAGLGVTYHFRSNRTRKRPGDTSSDTANTPISINMAISDGSGPAFDFTADGMPAPVRAYSDIRSNSSSMDGYVQITGGEAPWGTQAYPDSSHGVNYCYYAYLLEGERYLLEAMIDLSQATYHRLVADEFPLVGPTAPSTPLYSGMNDTINAAERQWSMSIVGSAVGVIPDAHVAARHSKTWLAHLAGYAAACMSLLPASWKITGAQPRYGLLSAPWMNGFTALSFYHAYKLTEVASLKATADALANQAIAMMTVQPYLTWSYHATSVANYMAPLTNPGNYPTPYWREATLTASIVASTGVVTIDDRIITNGDALEVHPTPQRTFPPELSAGATYYVVNANSPTCQLATTPGGAPLTFAANGGFEYASLMGAYTALVQAYPPHLDGADGYTGIARAVLVEANYNGHANATPELVARAQTFNAPSDVSGWVTWDYAAPVRASPARVATIAPQGPVVTASPNVFQVTSNIYPVWVSITQGGIETTRVPVWFDGGVILRPTRDGAGTAAVYAAKSGGTAITTVAFTSAPLTAPGVPSLAFGIPSQDTYTPGATPSPAPLAAPGKPNLALGTPSQDSYTPTPTPLAAPGQPTLTLGSPS